MAIRLNDDKFLPDEGVSNKDLNDTLYFLMDRNAQIPFSILKAAGAFTNEGSLAADRFIVEAGVNGTREFPTINLADTSYNVLISNQGNKSQSSTSFTNLVDLHNFNDYCSRIDYGANGSSEQIWSRALFYYKDGTTTHVTPEQTGGLGHSDAYSYSFVNPNPEKMLSRITLQQKGSNIYYTSTARNIQLIGTKTSKVPKLISNKFITNWDKDTLISEYLTQVNIPLSSASDVLTYTISTINTQVISVEAEFKIGNSYDYVGQFVGGARARFYYSDSTNAYSDYCGYGYHNWGLRILTNPNPKKEVSHIEIYTNVPDGEGYTHARSMKNLRWYGGYEQETEIYLSAIDTTDNNYLYLYLSGVGVNFDLSNDNFVTYYSQNNLKSSLIQGNSNKIRIRNLVGNSNVNGIMGYGIFLK